MELVAAVLTRIIKLGNCLGLRIPRSFATKLNLREGSAVRVTLDGDLIVVHPAGFSQYLISDLVSRICEDNVHDEVEAQSQVGREAW